MPEPRAQRTLVKSPPELWAEVSDAEALARHLGEFGEIRITKVEPESTVVWEGDRARGTVELEASGWGTKVTLSAEVPEAAPPPEPVAPEPEPVAVAAPEPAPEPEPEPEPVPPPPAAKVGFWARLFGRKPAPTPAADPAPVPEVVVAAPPEPEPVAAEPEPEPAPAPQPVATEPVLDAERAEAVLVEALDSLGSAHHRPFSRG